ncbi:hypothetical protein AYI70_g1713 [Smittium culicis]|uniref:Uncharacterized protein n=1 Tax=Smittium culicis TaxID=133412 RepID=A0A1R1YBD7_9FUNG|nr:hypothetical protein AYI70_g1713 [Smittium culicis]
MHLSFKYDANIDFMLAKRQIPSGESASRKRANVSSSIIPEANNVNYSIGHKLGLPNINIENGNELVESTLNTIIPVTIRHLIKADPEYRNSLIDVIKQRKVRLQGPQKSDSIPFLEKVVNNIFNENHITESELFDVLIVMPWIKDVILMSHIQENGEINFHMKSNINRNVYNFKVEIEPLKPYKPK